MSLKSLASRIAGLRNAGSAEENSRWSPRQKSIEDDPASLDLPCSVRLNGIPARTIKARIRHCNRGSLRIFAPQWILIGARVEVSFAGQSITGQVTFCDARDGGYALGIGYGQSEHVRQDPRIPVDLEASLFAAGDHLGTAIRIFDVSASGLGLMVPNALTVGSQVTVDVPDGKVSGEVCYCIRGDKAYRVGFAMQRFTPTTRSGARTHFAGRDPVGGKVLSSALAQFQSKKREKELLTANRI